MKACAVLMGLASTLLIAGCEHSTEAVSPHAADTVAVAQDIAVSDPGKSVLSAVVAPLADGGFVVAWNQFPGSDWVGGFIRATTFSAEGKAIATSTYTPEAGAYFSQPKVTALPDGGFALGWLSKDDDIHHDVLYLSSTKWDGLNRVTGSRLIEINRFSLAALPNGNVVVAYKAWDTTQSATGNWFTDFDADGKRLGGASSSVLDSARLTELSYSEVTSLAGGGWLAIRADKYGSHGLKLQPYTASGEISGEAMIQAGSWRYALDPPIISKTLGGDIFLSDGRGSASLLDAEGKPKKDMEFTYFGKVWADSARGRMWTFANDSMVALDSSFAEKGARALPAGIGSNMILDFAGIRNGKTAAAIYGGTGEVSHLRVLLLDPF